MFGFLKRLFAKPTYPHIDKMTSSQMQEFVCSEGITLGEYEYAKRRLWQSARA